MNVTLYCGTAIWYANTPAEAATGALKQAREEFNKATESAIGMLIETHNLSHSLTQLHRGEWCCSVVISVLVRE